MIYSQIGPFTNHVLKCYNGIECEVTLNGNGLGNADHIGIFHINTMCGDPQAEFFKIGLDKNPVGLAG